MRFLDNGSGYDSIPVWADFFLNLGYRFPESEPNSRSVILVSTPCDTPGAALVALGRIVRELEVCKSEREEQHKKRLIEYARQYIDKCKVCKFEECAPEIARCGFSKRADGRIKYERKVWEIIEPAEVQGSSVPRIKQVSDKHIVLYGFPDKLLKWQIVEEEPFVTSNTFEEISERIYGSLVEGASIIEGNTRYASSTTCLVGRSTGEKSTLEFYDQTKFEDNENSVSLGYLIRPELMKKGVAAKLVNFVNPRASKSMIAVDGEKVLVLDGIGYLGEYLENTQIDTFAVWTRLTNSHKQEDVANCLYSLRPFYSVDKEKMSLMGAVPEGIDFLVMTRDSA